MTSDAFLHGNTPSDLVRAAAETVPSTGGGGWHPPAPEVLQAMLPGFVILEFLARGGMGAVYRGEQASLGRPVAIKILPPQLRDADPNYAQRFKQEARAMARLNHPGIVSVYDFGEMPDGTLYFIMEFINGTDVGHMVARQGRLPSAHAMAITAHVCDALQYAHEHGVVHRDIKPANIMVGYDGRVKVADFGLAKSDRQQDTSLTVSGHVMGTPHFVAPEALTLGVDVDHRADIYAAGVMLYQMLTGRLPQGVFEMPSLQVSGLDPRYDAIISSAMREDRNQRYQNIRQMRRALDAIVTQPVARTDSPAQPGTAGSAAVMPPRAAPSKPAAGQHYYRPPQSATLPVRARRKSRSLPWLILATIIVLGGIVWLEIAARQPATPATATKKKPFINTLGMKFVPVPGTQVLMCVHETRLQDYEAYAREAEAGTVDPGYTTHKAEGIPCGHVGDHPVVGVNSFDAEAFCQWLSQKEGRVYRLPKWHEWSWAVGTGPMETPDMSVSEAAAAVRGIYPWGREWQLTPAAGNVGDESLHQKLPNFMFFKGYDDGHATTAPVMSFPANELGIHDLSGNVSEWCAEFSSKGDQRKLRGSTWSIGRQGEMVASMPQDGGQDKYLRWFDIGFRCVLELSDETKNTSATP
ncbi:MAG: bifunctional serine/threonine-protein kinase/formylglycine-generating enzyme family protein [Prosthecobacter sp.]